MKLSDRDLLILINVMASADAGPLDWVEAQAENEDEEQVIYERISRLLAKLIAERDRRAKRT